MYTSANGLGMHLSSSPPKILLAPCSLIVLPEKSMFINSFSSIIL